MSLGNVYKQLMQLDSTSSVNDKIKLLETFINDSLFLKVVRYALHPTKIYHVKKIPPFTTANSAFLLSSNTDPVKAIFKQLKKLAKQTGATDLDKKKLFALSSINDEVYEVVSRIVKKDLRCGVSVALINRVRPGTIPIIPYMRCSTDLSKIQWPAYSQVKEDQTFVNLIIKENGKLKFVTRGGQTVHQLGKLRKIIFKGVNLAKRTRNPNTRKIFTAYKPKYNYCNWVYMGELVVFKKGKRLPRQEGNGIINQCIKGTANEKDIQDIRFVVWDAVPYPKWQEGKYEVVYRTRFYKVRAFCDVVVRSVSVFPVKTKEVKNKKEAKKHYLKMRKRKKEGTVVKSLQGEWKDTSSGSKDQVKVKNETEAELIITEVYRGDKGKKYENCFGGLTCETADDKVRVDVGGGYSDKQRGYYPIRNKKGGIIGIDEKKAKEALEYWEKQKGKIVSVLFEGIVKDKKKKRKRLYLPRFNGERFDRNDADTLEILKKKLKEGGL